MDEYFHYHGSLTTGGCEESVNWVVFKNPIAIRVNWTTFLKQDFHISTFCRSLICLLFNRWGIRTGAILQTTFAAPSLSMIGSKNWLKEIWLKFSPSSAQSIITESRSFTPRPLAGAVSWFDFNSDWFIDWVWTLEKTKYLRLRRYDTACLLWGPSYYYLSTLLVLSNCSLRTLEVRMSQKDEDWS